VRLAASDPSLNDHGSVGGSSVQAGIALAEWFAYETQRVYAALDETDETDEQRTCRQIAEFVQRKGGTITPRQLRQGMRQFKDSTEVAEKALGELVKAGLGSWESVESGEAGGRPTRRFQLAPSVYVYETPLAPEKNGGFVDVDTSKGSEMEEFTI